MVAGLRQIRGLIEKWIYSTRKDCVIVPMSISGSNLEGSVFDNGGTNDLFK